MIRPVELDSAEGNDIWKTVSAAEAGDIAGLQPLLDRNPRLARAEYWYTPAVHFAAREGHSEAVRLLLDAGADPEWNGLNDRSLIEMARERGEEKIARLLEHARDQRGRVAAQPSDHPIHDAAARGDADAIRTLLDADAGLVDRADHLGGTPLHRAVLGGSPNVVTLLLDRGANIHAVHGSARGLAGGLVHDVHAIDLAIWGGRRLGSNLDIARLLVSREATYDLTVAAALGDLERVRRILDDDPSRIRETRPCGRRPLAAAIEFGNDDIAKLLLERGAHPAWDEPAAPRGSALHSASARGNLDMVRLLLEHGADPNEDVDSTASALAFAATPEIRTLLQSHGAGLDDFDTSEFERDDEALRRFAADSGNSHRVGAAFTMSANRPELLERLHGAGLRMPAVHTACQGYLLRADALRSLLAHGMSADQMNWQHQTLLHHASTATTSECAGILLDAGATITARDEEYRSTPLGWAARTNSTVLVEFLLSRGAPTNLPDEKPWATPLAWASRRGHAKVVELLRTAGATS
jgi:ankyrin repeat protein